SAHHGGAGRRLSLALGGMSNFTLRIVSAAILAPIVLGCVWLGGWGFFVLCAAAAAGVLWEWTRLVIGDADTRVLLPGLAALAAALLLAGFDEPGAAAAMIVIGAMLAGAVVAA